jgi:hypothetical protein
MTPPDTESYLAAFRRLAVKQGLLLGTLSAGRREDFVVALAAAAHAFDVDRDYDEAGVNAALKAWLAGPGSMFVTDHVELRRWLVDVGLLERDGYGRRYRRTVPRADWASAIAALQGLDLVAEAARARAAEHARRAERKARWTVRSDNPPGDGHDR